jgi:hypothetical protein
MLRLRSATEGTSFSASKLFEFQLPLFEFQLPRIEDMECTEIVNSKLYNLKSAIQNLQSKINKSLAPYFQALHYENLLPFLFVVRLR